MLELKFRRFGKKRMSPRRSSLKVYRAFEMSVGVLVPFSSVAPYTCALPARFVDPVHPTPDVSKPPVSLSISRRLLKA